MLSICKLPVVFCNQPIMKYLYIRIIFLLFASVSHSQHKIQYTKDSDTTLSVYKSKVEDRFDIQHISDLQEPYVFRSWNTYSLLEIRKDSTNQLTGTITYIANESTKEKNSSIYTKSFNLSLKEVIEMYKVITSSRIDTIPDDKLIAGWPHGFDGYTYTYQTKNGSVYSHKSYWCAGSYKFIPEAVAVEHFNNQLYTCLEKDYFKIFEEGMPFLAWHYAGSAVHIGKILGSVEHSRYYGEIHLHGPYVNKTVRYKPLKNHYAQDTEKMAVITTVIRDWRGYKFVNMSTPDDKGRLFYENFIILQRDTIPNHVIFNENTGKLLQKINQKLEHKFLAAKKTKPCLENITFKPFELDKLKLEINDKKQFIFTAEYDAVIACIPAICYRVIIPYSKIRKYLIETLTKVNE